MSESSQKKQWVFQRLVKPGDGELNVVGLVAYSLYKAKKDELATGLRKAGEVEEKIQDKLNDYHDNVLLNKLEQDDLITRAESLIDDAISGPYQEMLENLNKEYQKKIDALDEDKKAFNDSLKKLRSKIQAEEANKLKKAANGYQEPGFFVSTGLWLWGGFAGVAATLLTGVIVYGILAMLGTPEEKNRLVAQGATWLIETATGHSASEVNNTPQLEQEQDIKKPVKSAQL